MDYSTLPDWFLTFDIYDRKEGHFWSTARRNELTTRLGLSSVPQIFTGQTNVEKLKSLVLQEQSHFRFGPLEGFIIRQESSDWLEDRAKLVHPDFTQSITEHWSRRRLEWNRLAASS